MSSTGIWGEIFIVAQAVNYPKDDLTNQTQWYAARSCLPADGLSEDGKVKTCLQTLKSETFEKRSTINEDDARINIKTNGFLESVFSRKQIDVKVFYPYTELIRRHFRTPTISTT